MHRSLAACRQCTELRRELADWKEEALALRAELDRGLPQPQQHGRQPAPQSRRRPRKPVAGLMTIQDAADMLGVTHMAVYLRIKRGSMKSVHLSSRDVRVPVSAVQAWKAARAARRAP